MIEVVAGDITTFRVDAVVNAANPSLLGGGGVDGAIHRAAGPGLLAECRTLGGCAPGEAKVTHAYGLPARIVVHTVGPVWQGGAFGEDATLAACYRSSLRVAGERGARTVAFPSIATGAYGFPLHRAAGIAIATLAEVMRTDGRVARVTMVCRGHETARAYEDAVADLLE
ncbi:MAG: O-acetyl-ADP-ribose deacetylase [Chloroflexota bacterium]|nr:O-acetyl-ADP-ribose deacetylase [Chloroflexota bacterium]MDQ3512539.1 O-acetyl-ADP-ribose deacetylase [Chloroflexota bacterium]